MKGEQVQNYPISCLWTAQDIVSVDLAQINSIPCFLVGKTTIL